MRTPTWSRWMSNNYITRSHRRLEVVSWSSRQQWVQVPVAVGVRVAVPVGDRMLAEWESAPDRGLGPSVTLVEQLNRMRKKCCYGQRNFRSICSSLYQSPTHLSHITNINPFATLSRIKCERYIFYKEVRSFIILCWLHILCWLCFCLYMYMYCVVACGYTTTIQSDGKASVMLELWRTWSTASLALLPGQLTPGQVALDRVLPMSQKELFDI